MLRPCSAITGRSGPECPGGSAIAHSVSLPPRAAEVNDPVRYVGDALADAGDGWSGGGAPVAVARPSCHIGSSAHAPAIPAPSRKTVRRVNSAISVSAEGQPTGERALAGVAEHLPGIAAALGRPCATPHSAGLAPQHDRRRAAAVEQHGVVGTQSAEQILDLVGRVAAALEDVQLIVWSVVSDRGPRRARSAVVELAGVTGGEQADARDRHETRVLVEQLLDHRRRRVVVAGALRHHDIRLRRRPE